MIRRYRDTVTRQRGSVSEDAYGNSVVSWANPATATLRASVQPQDSSEQVADESRVVVRYRVHLEPDADVTAADRIVWRGSYYEVDGEPEMHSIDGVAHHLELLVRRVEW